MATVWTKAAEEKLKRLRAQGYTYATIAAMMGTTKGVILGHVYRAKIRSGHRPNHRKNSKKPAVSVRREIWARRRLDAVTMTLVGYSNRQVAKLFDADHTQVSKWRHDPEIWAKAEEIASRLPRIGKTSKPKQKRVISPEVRAQRAEHMRRVARRYWDEKRAAQ